LERGDLALEGGLRADDPQDLAVEWSPRLGLRYRIGDSGWLLRSSWSRAFKLPSFFALASPPALGGNPDLRPETSEGADLGLELERGAARAGVALWTATYEDLVDFDFERFTHVNRSRIEAEGIELTGRWQPIEALRVSTAWTLQEVDGERTANVVLHSPEWFGNVGLEWSAADSVRLRVDARFADKTEDVQIPVPDRTRVAGHQVVDVAASWRVAERWLVSARVDNAAGEDYEQMVGFPQPGRTARAGFHYDFR
jgi:vitamin B12 transporter